jgi:hypothetical protein
MVHPTEMWWVRGIVMDGRSEVPRVRHIVSSLSHTLCGSVSDGGSSLSAASHLLAPVRCWCIAGAAARVGSGTGLVRWQPVSRIRQVVVERAVSWVLWILQCEREREGGQLSGMASNSSSAW